MLAVQAREASPDGMQHLLERARWDADGVDDDVRDYVIAHLGHPGAVLVVDETGDVMRLVGWLDRPAADFVVLRVLRSPG